MSNDVQTSSRPEKVLVFGHQGAAGHAPENTLAAFESAIRLGADFIELDVHAVKGELLVIHDARLERSTNGDGRIYEQAIEYIRALDAGDGQRVPFLREVFNLIDRRIGINIEIKNPGAVDLVAGLIREYIERRGWTWEHFFVSSFLHPELVLMKTQLPLIRISPLIFCVPLGYAEFAGQMNAYSVNISADFVNQGFINDAHRRGIKVFVFTPNHPDEIERTIVLGADGIITDFPERAIRILEGLKLRGI